jgi:flagellar protein FlgJ
MSIAIGSGSTFQLPVSNMEASSTKKLESKLKDNDLDKMPDEDLMEACKSFETYFVEQVIKAMRKTVPNNEEENDYMNYFGDMLYQIACYFNSIHKRSGYLHSCSFFTLKEVTRWLKF